MSILRKGQEKLHYNNGAHRWVAPSEDEQESWEAMVRAHLEEHRATPDARPVRRPRQT